MCSGNSPSGSRPPNTRAPRGSGTFGYDPYFEYENGLTFAEMEGEAKNAVSHRARAMQEALKLL